MQSSLSPIILLCFYIFKNDLQTTAFFFTRNFTQCWLYPYCLSSALSCLFIVQYSQSCILENSIVTTFCLCIHILVYPFFSFVCYCKGVDQKILPRLKKLMHWKMCRFQQTSHWILMLRTLRSSNFLIFMPRIDYLKLSSRNGFIFNIISELIKCLTIILFLNL